MSNFHMYYKELLKGRSINRIGKRKIIANLQKSEKSTKKKFTLWFLTRRKRVISLCKRK